MASYFMDNLLCSYTEQVHIKISEYSHHTIFRLDISDADSMHACMHKIFENFIILQNNYIHPISSSFNTHTVNSDNTEGCICS